MTEPPNVVADPLLAWYDRHRRSLPWRAGAGNRSDPYLVWLSEIMLQQTTVAVVGDYFRRFVERWPTVDDLGRASLDEVLHAWQGLGYYARARNLHRCARFVAEDLGGKFPDTEDGLRSLPGVGAYTAAAIAAIAFDRPAVVVDGNIERVIARVFAIDSPLPAGKAAIRSAAAGVAPACRPGDYAQALMDLGATICTPRKPRCMLCPISDSCEAFRRDIAEELPRQVTKPKRPVRLGVAFWIERPDGSVLIRRRAESGLLGGMMEVPSSVWREEAVATEDAVAEAPLAGEWRHLPGMVRHVFTHFELRLSVLATRVAQSTPAPAASIWVPVDGLGDYALPAVMKKIVKLGIAQAPTAA